MSRESVIRVGNKLTIREIGITVMCPGVVKDGFNKGIGSREVCMSPESKENFYIYQMENIKS